MRTIDRLNDIFKLATESSGYVNKHTLYRITNNTRLIDEIAEKHGCYPIYKRQSKNILGYGDERHQDLWLDTYKNN